MEIEFLPEAEEDLNFWAKTGNKPVLKKITQLVEGIPKNPFEGIDKHEPLKHSLTGSCSHRINKQHRLVYEIWDSKSNY